MAETRRVASFLRPQICDTGNAMYIYDLVYVTDVRARFLAFIVLQKLACSI